MSEESLQQELQAITQRFFRELKGEVDFSKASIQWILGNYRQLVGAFGFDKEESQSRLLRPVNTDPIIEEIVRTQALRIIPDTNTAGDWEKQPGTRDVNSWIGWPLVFEGETVGVLTLDHETPGFYGDLSRERIASLDQMITATVKSIQRIYAPVVEAHKFESLRIHDKGLELILSIGRKILQAADIKAVLNAVVSGAIELTHTDSGVIFLLSAGGTDVLDVFHPEGFAHPPPRLDNPDGITRTVVATKMPILIPDIKNDRRANPLLNEEYRSMFAIPLILDDFVIGVLYLNGKMARNLTETEQSLLKTLADQAALAVQIKNSEAMYHAIPQSLLFKDRRSRIRAANASFCASLQQPPHSLKEKDIVGKRDHDFYDDDTADAYVAMDQAVMDTGMKQERDELHQSPIMQEPVWVHVVKSPVFGVAGEVIGVQAIFWDITVQKQNQARWESLAMQSPDGIVVHMEGKITLANSAACRMFGAASADELKHCSILDFVHEESRELAADRLEKLMKKEEVEMARMRVRSKTGTVLETEVYARAGPGNNEVQVVLHDLTRRHKLMQEIEAHAKRSEHMMQMAAHESFAPLQGIIDSLAELKSELRSQPEKIQRLADEIEECVYRAKLQMDNAQSFDRPANYVFEEYSLSPLIERIVREFTSRSAERNVQIEVHESAQHLPVMRIDHERMGQVIRNLLANAVKYGVKHETIHIGGEILTNHVAVVLKNLAEDMPQKLKDRIFERDKQMPAEELGRLVSGSGIGCPLIKTIVEGHGGKVFVDAVPETYDAGRTAPKVLVTFRIEIPIDGPPAAAAPQI